MEFDTRPCHGECPVNPARPFVAVRFPGRHLSMNCYGIVDATVQALTLQDAQCDFRHVEPTAVFGSRVESEPIEQTSRFFRRKRVIEARSIMGVEVVFDQDNFVSTRVMHLTEFLDTPRPILARPALRHLDAAPPPQWLVHHKQVTGALGFIRIIDACHSTRCRRRCHRDLANQLLIGLVQADHRDIGVVEGR